MAAFAVAERLRQYPLPQKQIEPKTKPIISISRFECNY